MIESEFTPEEFRHVAALLRQYNLRDADFRAVLSANSNIILSALDVAAASLDEEAKP